MTPTVVITLPEALRQSDIYLLGRARTRLIRRLADEHAELGIRIGQGAILICLADQGPLSQRDIARLLDVDPSELVRAIDQLEQHGLVERRADADDRRRNVLTITDSGRDLRGRYDTMISRVEAELFGSMAPENRTSLREALQSLAGL